MISERDRGYFAPFVPVVASSACADKKQRLPPLGRMVERYCILVSSSSRVTMGTDDACTRPTPQSSLGVEISLLLADARWR